MTSKLLNTLGVVFMFTAATAISVPAQTQAGGDSSLISSAANVATTTDAKKAEDTRLSTTTSEKRAPEKTAAALPSPQSVDADKWQFQFSPYLWLAGLHGNIGTSNRTVRLDQNFSDILPSLKFAFMGVLEARKNKFVLRSDLEYVSLEDDKATPGPLFSSANAKVKSFLFNPEVGYQLFANPEKGVVIEVMGGVRVMHISTDFTFAPGILPLARVQGTKTWVDGVVGMQGKVDLSKKVFLTGKFDLGGGGSKFTYRLFGGLGVNVSKKIALIGGYRVLDVNYDKNNFVYDISQRGLIMGASFKF